MVFHLALRVLSPQPQYIDWRNCQFPINEESNHTNYSCRDIFHIFTLLGWAAYQRGQAAGNQAKTEAKL